MNKQRLKQIIREEIINELSKGSTFVNYPHYGAEFPMLDTGYFQQPEDIDVQKHYLQFQSLSKNQDLDQDKFPYEEFKRGIEFERAKNPILNHTDIAEIVIGHLKDDAAFYKKMLNQDPVQNEFGDLEKDRDQEAQDDSNPERKTMNKL